MSIVTIFTESDYGDVFTVKFYDGNGDPTSPDTVTYQVDCITNDTVLVTGIDTSGTTVLDLPTTTVWTQVVDTSNIYEMRRLSITAEGETWKKTSYTTFKIENAKRIDE